MRLISFKTPKPKSFNYTPRYYDPKKEELEKRKAALGVENSLSHNEELRLRISSRWSKHSIEDDKPLLTKMVTYLIYATFIGGSIYFILFTNIIEKMLQAFGVTN
jgi:uncharacterized membrane protein YraQ (UPF0718 family)